MIASGVIGAVYGVALLFGLQVIIDLFNCCRSTFLGSLGQVSAVSRWPSPSSRL